MRHAGTGGTVSSGDGQTDRQTDSTMNDKLHVHGSYVLSAREQCEESGWCRPTCIHIFSDRFMVSPPYPWALRQRFNQLKIRTLSIRGWEPTGAEGQPRVLPQPPRGRDWSTTEPRVSGGPGTGPSRYRETAVFEESEVLRGFFTIIKGLAPQSPTSVKGQLHNVRWFALLNRSHGKSEVARAQRFEAKMPPWRANSLLASWKNSKKPSVAVEERRWEDGKERPRGASQPFVRNLALNSGRKSPSFICTEQKGERRSGTGQFGTTDQTSTRTAKHRGLRKNALVPREEVGWRLSQPHVPRHHSLAA